MIPIKAKHFDDVLVNVVVLVEVLYSFRFQLIDWLEDKAYDYESLEADFTKVIWSKLSTIFDSFLVNQPKPGSFYFKAGFALEDEAHVFAKGFMKHTLFFDGFKVIETNDIHSGDLVYLVMLYVKDKNEKKEYIKEKIIIN